MTGLAQSPDARASALREDLFDGAFLRRIEHLALLARRMASSGQRAQRRSKKIGSGIEFADHRDYVPGDDLRYIDWTVYGRTERLLLKQYEEEEDLSVYFLVDRSASMGMAPPGRLSLFDRALQVTAALAWISLSNLDRVSVVPFADAAAPLQRPVRGKAQFFRILRDVSTWQPGGKTAVRQSLGEFARRKPRRGLVLVISDFYDPTGLADGLRLLAHHGHEPLVLQLFDGAMFDAQWWGDLALVDVESGEQLDVTVTPRLMKQYRRAFEAFSEEIGEAARQAGARCLRVDVALPFDEVVMKIFRLGGFLG